MARKFASWSPGPQHKSVTLIAAMGRNRVIGKNGQMPWHLPADLQHFKKTTMGKPLVMGRKTFESIGQALPGRQNIVVSRNPDFAAHGCQRAGSLAEAMEMAQGPEVMIIGGGELYRQAMPLADKLVITLVDAEPDGDTWFPAWHPIDWSLKSEKHIRADESNPHGCQILQLERVPPSANP